MRKYVFFLLGGVVIAVFNSCMAPKMILAEDMKADMPYNVTVSNEMKIQCDDKLSIMVHASNPELAIPFNRGSFKVNAQGDVSVSDAVSNEHIEGYMVDSDGNIDFPVLGKMHAEGLTRRELSNCIAQNLIRSNLIRDPLVTIELLNLKIPVLGEVQNVGVLTAPEGRMTIVEAITRAGGLTSNALPEKISVFRSEGKERKVLVVNFRSKDLFESPAYYLQQNDIVFVHPRSARTTETENRSWRNYSTLIGLISLATTILWYLKN